MVSSIYQNVVVMANFTSGGFLGIGSHTSGTSIILNSWFGGTQVSSVDNNTMLFNNVTSSTVMLQNTSVVVNQTFTNNGSSVIGN